MSVIVLTRDQRYGLADRNVDRPLPPKRVIERARQALAYVASLEKADGQSARMPTRRMFDALSLGWIDRHGKVSDAGRLALAKWSQA